MCVLTQIRERKQDGADPVFVNDLLNGSLDSRFGANVDPSDPSTVFLHQPEVVSRFITGKFSCFFFLDRKLAIEP